MTTLDLQFPAATLAEAIPHFRRPFAPEVLDFRVIVNPRSSNGSALCAAFIDARDVMDRLNQVCPGEWEIHRYEDTAGGVRCYLRVYGKTFTDVGTNSKPTTEMGVKGMHSDAFKRAAVALGIGRSLYALPKLSVSARKLNEKQGRDGVTWEMTWDAMCDLREQYQRWLRQKGVAEFGQPLPGYAAAPAVSPPAALPAEGGAQMSVAEVAEALGAEGKETLRAAVLRQLPELDADEKEALRAHGSTPSELVEALGEDCRDLRAFLRRRPRVDIADEDLPAELRDEAENAAGTQTTATTEETR